MLQLEDLVANYPPTNIPGIQTIMSAKREFIEVGALRKEPTPIPGVTFYNNQRFLLRYMIPNDRLLVNWQTGTGKTCGLSLLAEYYRDLYLKDPDNAPIKRTIVLTPGPSLRDDLRLQIACRCTKGQYLTPKVLEATRPRNQKGNLTRSIGQWYTIETYKRFILPLEELSDEEIRRRYSRTIIFVDEAHNLIVLGKGGKETKKQTLYQQLWRLLHLVEGSKIILATATPMINETREIAPLMNLILDIDQQLPEDWDYNNVTMEELEPYFRGKISFVRALDTGINIILEGEPHDVIINTPEGDITTTIIAKTSVMGDIQAEGYARAQEMKSGVYDNERQASNCVFPDGSWGGTFPREAKTPEQAEQAKETGIGRYVISPSPDNYRPTEEFRQWLRIVDNPAENEPHLGRIASKYETTIREVKAGTRGTVFVYNDFVFGSGAIVQALAFEVNGFERYKGDTPAFQDVSGATLAHPCSNQVGARKILLDQRPRYALITSETSAVNISRILDLFSSPENVHGDYIKVLIGSQITREGLNLSHGTQIHLTTTWWNRSANYQAISRAIRATSHVSLLDEERRRLQELGEDPDRAVIDVQIFQHAALPKEGDFLGSIDIFMYELADRKDYNIRRMERIMKQIAIDCWLHYERNVRICDSYRPGCDCWNEENGQVCNDYSADCDYAPCQYECHDPIPTKLDLETYDVYYIDETLDRAVTSIIQLFSNNFSFLRAEIYYLLDEFRPVEIDRALTRIMAGKHVIYDRYGFLSYLREDKDRFFLQRDFPLSASSEGSQALEVYTANLIASREISLQIYLSQLDADVQDKIINEIITLPEDDPRFEEAIGKLNHEGRISLLEKAVYDYVSNPTPSLQRVIEYFTSFLYILFEPTADIEAVEERLTTRSKGRGRPPKKSGRTRGIKLKPEDLIEDPEEIPLDKVQLLVTEGSDREVVFLHVLYNITFDRVSYNVTTKFKKGNGRLRIFKPSEDVGWRDAKINEIPIYSIVIEKIRERRLAPFEQFDIYGTLLQDNKFRIRDKTTERTRQQQGTGRSDTRYGKRGRVCKTFDKADLITILWKLGVEAPPAKRRLPTSPEELIDYLTRKRIIKSTDDLDEWDEERLEYYTRWESFGSRDKICGEIQKYFAETGRLLTI